LIEFVSSYTAYVPTTATTTTQTDYVHAATIKIGTAVNKDFGSTVIDNIPVTWGRWEGGSVDVYNLDGSTKLGAIPNANKSIHWIASGVLTGPVDGYLPISGTASYPLAGNTSPTDTNGNIGTLSSATLSADFTRMLVNTAVTANFSSTSNNSVWSMTANNIPIGSHGGFESASLSSGVNGVTHTATCTGSSCGSQTIGAVSGKFIGTAAAGAIFSYRMSTGLTTTSGSTTTFNPLNSVMGVAVFKK